MTSPLTSQDSWTKKQKQQYDYEVKCREEYLGKKLKESIEQHQKGRVNTTEVGRGLLRAMVPAIAKYLELHEEAVKRRQNNVGYCLAQYSRLKQYIDPFTMAHIAMSVVLNSLGRGICFKKPINSIRIQIGRELEDQAFMQYMQDTDPNGFKRLQERYLHDPVRRYDKKVYVMKFMLNRSEHMSWEFMSEQDLVRVGAFMLRAVMSIPCEGSNSGGFFEAKRVYSGKKETLFLGYSLCGIKFRDKLQELADKYSYQPLPMLCEPLPWSLDKRGGYLMHPPAPYGDLIHSHNPTVPSQASLDALNKLQKIPYRINEYILDLQLDLLKKSNEIGSFRSYESESWKDEHFPVVDSDYLSTLSRDSKEYKEIMNSCRDAYNKQRLDEKEAINPRRVVMQAEKYRGKVFYTPWFFDSRLRMYPISDLGITKGDFVKALLVNADPMPVTEQTRNELLIAIATSGGKAVAKLSYQGRLAWAEKFVESMNFEKSALYPESSSFWKEMDEPFQFLSYCEEYYALFVSKTRKTTRVWIGRDMSCSGIQFLSSLIGDQKAMAYTNVIPSNTLQDAYAEVAKVAQTLLADKGYLRRVIDKREQKRLRKLKKNPEANHKDQRMHIEVDLDSIDRSVVKTQVMVTGYGGTYQSKREYIIEKLQDLAKKGTNIHPDDFEIVVNACISGMERAFPKYSELNAWFKDVAKTACKQGAETIQWTTPNGSKIVQDYREPVFTQVRTHAAGGGHYRKMLSDENGNAYVITGLGAVKPSKHASAIAANFTHSLDACMIQDGVNLTQVPIVTVHDCVYGQPGYMHEVVPNFRASFHNVVTTPVLENLLEENELEEVMQPPTREEVDLSVCLNSEYMFS